MMDSKMKEMAESDFSQAELNAAEVQAVEGILVVPNGGSPS